MKLKENEAVYFDEISHSYWMGDKELIGVTTLMKKHGVSANYEGISEAVLEHAADLGTQAHKAIENYCDGLATLDIPLIKTFKKLKLKIIHTEYLISDNKMVASSIDLVQEVGKNEVVLIDMKRTQRLHGPALSWQLGIYKYLFERQCPDIKVVGCACLPIAKGNKEDIFADKALPLMPVTPVTAEQVEALLNAEAKGETYSELPKALPTEGALTKAELTALVKEQMKLEKHSMLIKQIEAAFKAKKEQLLSYMVENNIKEIPVKGGKFTLKDAYSRTTVDSAKLKEEKPAIYEKYSKTTTVKPSLTFKEDKL